MFKITGDSVEGLRKLRRDIYNTTHNNRAQPQGTTQYQPQINQQQPNQVQTHTQQAKLQGTSDTPLVINNIYNNIPQLTQTVTNYVKKFNLLITILYVVILIAVIIVLWNVITNGEFVNWLNQGINKLHEILTTIF